VPSAFENWRVFKSMLYIPRGRFTCQGDTGPPPRRCKRRTLLRGQAGGNAGFFAPAALPGAALGVVTPRAIGRGQGGGRGLPPAHGFLEGGRSPTEKKGSESTFRGKYPAGCLPREVVLGAYRLIPRDGRCCCRSCFLARGARRSRSSNQARTSL